MLYQEQFADTRALMGEIDSFLTHVEPLNIKLSGDVLVIGPAPDLIDLVVVEPQLNRVKSITIVDQDFRAERAGFLSIFQQCHPDVAVTLIQPKRFQDLTQTFDAIIFIGASAYFHICNSLFKHT